MNRRLRLDLGKRAGVTSGLLGVLCVLAEFCFLFPDLLVTRSAAFIPIFVLGFSQAALVAYVAFVSFHAVYIHSNTRWRFPTLRWLIATPEYHHWHHTSDEEGIDKNFAAFLPMWDRLFGTAHLPQHWPKKYGTVKFQPPESYLGQLAYPFRSKKATPYG